MGKRNVLPDLVGASEAATILGCSRWTVQRLARTGDLVPVLELPAGRFFARVDIERLAAERAA